MSNFLIIDFGSTAQQIMCENRNCKADTESGKAYSWKHVKDLGWTFEQAITEKEIVAYATKTGESIYKILKCSPYNPMLKDASGKFISVYCPECSKAKKEI
jgi:hypothetical protein